MLCPDYIYFASLRLFDCMIDDSNRISAILSPVNFLLVCFILYSSKLLGVAVKFVVQYIINELIFSSYSNHK